MLLSKNHYCVLTMALRFMYICTLVTCASVVSYALDWSASLQDDARLYACVGDNVTLPWSFTTDSGESVVDIEWYKQLSGQPEAVFATFASGHFFSIPGENVQFVPNAGLQLLDVALDDTGAYSVNINLIGSSDPEPTHKLTAHLVVAEKPETLTGDLQVRQLADPVLDPVTRDWQIQLSCGTFSSLGQPPVSVVWTLPSGEQTNASTYENGNYVLTLTNPVGTGNYSCRVPNDLPSALCLENYSPLLEEAYVFLDEVEVRLALLEVRQDELLRENAILRQNGLYLAAENNELVSSIHNLTNELQRIQQNYEILNMLYHPSSCVDVLQYAKESGIHMLYINGYPPFQVYCDQITFPAGWTVFQRRQNGVVDFYRDWTEYVYGFGDLREEFWLGLEHLHAMTTQRPYELRVDLEDFEGNKTFATYSGFRISGPTDNYRLHYDNFTDGGAGNSLIIHNGMEFTTWDADHDVHPTANCASYYHGAWWYEICHTAHLNGEYKHNSSAPLSDGISWNTFRGVLYSLKFAEMKMRPM